MDETQVYEAIKKYPGFRGHILDAARYWKRTRSQSAADRLFEFGIVVDEIQDGSEQGVERGQEIY